MDGPPASAGHRWQETLIQDRSRERPQRRFGTLRRLASRSLPASLHSGQLAGQLLKIRRAAPAQRPNHATAKQPDSHLTFTQRLARDNGWTIEFARRVVLEYRRFCYLAVAAGHPVTPSDAVDQAWHLHLTYSRDYWNVFCPEVLGTDLHHGPTTGGKQEGMKYRNWYQHTVSSYQEAFGEPPADIWPDLEHRFRHASEFVRINRAEVIILNRTRTVGTAAAVMAGLAVSSAIADDQSSTGFFLMFIIGLIAVVIVVALIIEKLGSGRKDGGGGCGPGGTGGSKGSDGGDGGCGSGCGGCGG